MKTEKILMWVGVAAVAGVLVLIGGMYISARNTPIFQTASVTTGKASVLYQGTIYNYDLSNGLPVVIGTSGYNASKLSTGQFVIKDSAGNVVNTM